MPCENCGTANDRDATSCRECGQPLSDPDASLDRMVHTASVPDLATLFKRAKDKGAIGPVSNYGEGKPA